MPYHVRSNCNALLAFAPPPMSRLQSHRFIWHRSQSSRSCNVPEISSRNPRRPRLAPVRQSTPLPHHAHLCGPPLLHILSLLASAATYNPPTIHELLPSLPTHLLHRILPRIASERLVTPFRPTRPPLLRSPAPSRLPWRCLPSSTPGFAAVSPPSVPSSSVMVRTDNRVPPRAAWFFFCFCFFFGHRADAF